LHDLDLVLRSVGLIWRLWGWFCLSNLQNYTLVFGFDFREFDVLARPSRLRINAVGEAHPTTTDESGDWGGFVGTYSRVDGGFSRGKACFPRENEFFHNITWRILREIGGVFFLRIGRGHFLERYAVFLRTFCRFGLEAGRKTGVHRLGFHKGQGGLTFVDSF
jgi:hypothetical protein